MKEIIAIVTGASRGIGEAVCALLLRKGCRVIGISRGVSGKLEQEERFRQIGYDLSDTEGIGGLMDGILAGIEPQRVGEILLINNAAMLEPLKALDRCAADEITRHLQVGLLAPAALCAGFIRHTYQWPVRKRIVNVTSGLGEHPAPAMSLYCSSKAGLNMLTRCIAEEQKERSYPVEAIVFNPGMVETAMQEKARSRPEEEFPLQTFFRASHENGKLASPEAAAVRLLELLELLEMSGSG